VENNSQWTLYTGVSPIKEAQRMSNNRLRQAAQDAPPPPAYLKDVTCWLETYIRKPLEGTWFDVWVATPAKNYYLLVKRKD